MDRLRISQEYEDWTHLRVLQLLMVEDWTDLEDTYGGRSADEEVVEHATEGRSAETGALQADSGRLSTIPEEESQHDSSLESVAQFPEPPHRGVQGASQPIKGIFSLPCSDSHGASLTR